MDAIMKWWDNLIHTLNTFDYAGFIKWAADMLTFEMFMKILVIYFLILWMAIIVWVTKDIINRTNNIFYQVISILSVLALTPIFWIVVYLLIRPSKTLFEKHYEETELEQEYQETQLKEVATWENECENIKCHNCGYEVQKDFKFCPKCRVELRKACNVCKKMIEPDWENCPYCGSFQGEKKEGAQLELKVDNNEDKIKEEDKLENKNPKSFSLFKKKDKKNTEKSNEETDTKEDKKLEEKISGDSEDKPVEEVKTKAKKEKKPKSENIKKEVKTKAKKVLEDNKSKK